MDGVIEREAAALGVAAGRTPRRHYENQVSMGSFVDATDIAEAAAFLSSPAARFISGQVLGVDGHTETLRTNLFTFCCEIQLARHSVIVRGGLASQIRGRLETRGKWIWRLILCTVWFQGGSTDGN